jgi:carbon monoxide dehydrogenase subunit G
MRLLDEFTIPVPPDRAYELLLDLERVAPCVPGGQIGPPDAEGRYPGRVSVKLGPMRFVYSGSVRIAETDTQARRAVIEGEGRASGAETARVRSVMEVLPEGDGSRVRMTTDLDIRGRAARMGQGVIADVSRRLVGQAAACLAVRLAAPPDADPDSLPTAGEVGGVGLVASMVSGRVGDSLRRLGARRGGDPRAAAEGAGAGAVRDDAAEGS